MDYQKIYDRLVQKNHIFSEGEYFETHHKIPRSMGGTDDKSNLVNLTAREHYIAHLLLVKIAEKKNDKTLYGKMLYAFNCMKWGRCKGQRSFKFNSRLYQKMKERYSKLRHRIMQTSRNPSIGKHWVMNMQLKTCKLVDNSYLLEDGWVYGRCSFLPKVLERREKEMSKKEKARQTRIQKRQKQIQRWRDMYNFFTEHNNDFELMVEVFNWHHTRSSFMTACKRYLSEYTPLPNNRWKNKN